MVNGSCKRYDNNGGVKKTREAWFKSRKGGRSGSGRLCNTCCTVLFGLRFVLRFILQHPKWRSLCFDLHLYLPSEWKRRRKSLFLARDHQRRNRLRCTTTKRMWSWSSLILKTVGNWIRLPVNRYWADLTCNSNRSCGMTAGHCKLLHDVILDFLQIRFPFPPLYPPTNAYCFFSVSCFVSWQLILTKNCFGMFSRDLSYKVMCGVEQGLGEWERIYDIKETLGWFISFSIHWVVSMQGNTF